MNKKIVFIILGAIALCAFLFLGSGKFGGGLVSSNRSSVTIGTSASPITLTNTNVTSSALRTDGMKDVAVGYSYLPKSLNSKLYLQIERSLDNGNTYVPYSLLDTTSSTSQVFNYTYGATSTQGIPIVIPSNVGATSGTTITGSFDLKLVADYLRIGVREYTSSTYGTVYVQMLMND